MNVQNLMNYFLRRLTEKFTGKITFTFDKGVIVHIDRHTSEEVMQFR